MNILSRAERTRISEQIERDLIDCRTYERGVEDETRACGTGSVAAGLVTYLLSNPDVKNKSEARMRVKTKSGEILHITFDLTDSKIRNVYLKGSAKFIAEGEYFFRS